MHRHGPAAGRTLPVNSSATLLKMGLSVRQGPQLGDVYSTTTRRSLSWYSLRSANCPRCRSAAKSTSSGAAASLSDAWPAFAAAACAAGQPGFRVWW